MRHRSLLAATLATAALSALPLTAHAAQAELIDRSNYVGSVERTADSVRIAAATSGELGGYLDVTMTAQDGSLPVGSEVCEPVTIDAVLTVAPAETFTLHVPGEACTTFYGDALRGSADFDNQDVAYEGTHKKVKVVGEGRISATVGGIFPDSGQANFSATVRW